MDTSIRSAGGCPCRPAPGQADPLPFYAPGGCGAPSFLETTAATPMETLLLYGSYAAVWAVMWLACGLLVVPVVSRMPPSSKAHENNSMYADQKVAASLKAWAVGGIANLALSQYATMPTGSLDVAFAGHPLMDFAGILFTGFEVADLALGLGYGFLDATHIVHHILHIATCGFGLLAATLMAQETSGLPLNYYLLMRHRAPDHWSTQAAQVAFAGAFFSWRLLVAPMAPTTSCTMHATTCRRTSRPRRRACSVRRLWPRMCYSGIGASPSARWRRASSAAMRAAAKRRLREVCCDGGRITCEGVYLSEKVVEVQKVHCPGDFEQLTIPPRWTPNTIQYLVTWGAIIYRDMMLDSTVVCRRALGCEWGGGKCRTLVVFRYAVGRRRALRQHARARKVAREESEAARASRRLPGRRP